MASKWKVRLSEAAQLDFDELYLWTLERFGADQADSYRRLVLDALISLEGGPTTVDVKSHAEIPRHLKTFDVARKGKKGRHVIVFDASMSRRIQVLRILHDAMDLPRHLNDDHEDDL
jgi:toxin ParE1/3/4